MEEVNVRRNAASTGHFQVKRTENEYGGAIIRRAAIETLQGFEALVYEHLLQ